MPDPSKHAEPKDPRIEAALRQYLEWIDGGESVNREEFLSQHAEIADDLRSFLAAEDEVRKLAGVQTPGDRARESTKSFAGRGHETLVPQSMAKRPAESLGSGLTGQFGRYRIVRTLGQGAMGMVYLAEDTQLERQVALKTPHFKDDPSEETLERFYREARAAATLRNAHICPVFDVGQIDGTHYISMAYIAGHPLSAFIQPDKPQTERQIAIVIRKLALALQEAHEQGIVHRDLKPANIMVDKKGEPIIMDFGLARQLRRDEDIRLTQSGVVIGTPAFMSPEQVDGDPEKVGPPTDQYSLGVILYELLTSQLPFRGSVLAVMGQILTREVPAPSRLRPDLDPRIEAVCLKMIAKNPTDRFASMSAVAAELETILRNPATESAVKEKPGPPVPLTPADRPTEAKARTSQCSASLRQSAASLRLKALTQRDLASLDELARKCYSRRDYDQVIQIIERVPQAHRSESLQGLLKQARDRTDEIALLICDIDDAVRLNDRSTAHRKAEDLLKIEPGHQRARAIQEKFAGCGEVSEAQIGPLQRFTKTWNEGGWIPRSVLAFGLAAFAVMTGVIVFSLRGTAVVIDVRDPGVSGPDKHSSLDRDQATPTGASRVAVEAPGSVANPPNTSAGFAPLFNGKDLAGWNKVHSGTVDWTATLDGTLVGRNESNRNGTAGTLVTDRTDYADFHFCCEAMLSEGRSSAIGFRRKASALKQGDPTGYRVMIADANAAPSSQAGEITGSIWIDHDRAPSRLLQEAADFHLKRGEWFKLEIIADGRRLQVKINGEIAVQRFDEDALAVGAMSLTCRPSSTVRFRNVEIKELVIEELASPQPAAPAQPTVPAPAPVAKSGAVIASIAPTTSNAVTKTPLVDKTLESARAQFAAAVQRANERLLSLLNVHLKSREMPHHNTEERLRLIVAAKQERDAFAARRFIPWSAHMRRPLLAYLASVHYAEHELERAFDTAMEQAAKNHDEPVRAALAAEKEAALAPRVIAVTDCVGSDGRKWKFSLYSNSKLNEPTGPGFWRCSEKLLVLNVPKPRKQNGFFIDTCTLAADGKTFAAVNQYRYRYKGQFVDQ